MVFFYNKEGKASDFYHLVINLLDTFNRFYPFDFYEVHDEIVQVICIVDIQINASFEDTIVADEVNVTHIYGEFL